MGTPDRATKARWNHFPSLRNPFQFVQQNETQPKSGHTKSPSPYNCQIKALWWARHRREVWNQRSCAAGSACSRWGVCCRPRRRRGRWTPRAGSRWGPQGPRSASNPAPPPCPPSPHSTGCRRCSCWCCCCRCRLPRGRWRRWGGRRVACNLVQLARLGPAVAGRGRRGPGWCHGPCRAALCWGEGQGRGAGGRRRRRRWCWRKGPLRRWRAYPAQWARTASSGCRAVGGAGWGPRCTHSPPRPTAPTGGRRATWAAPAPRWAGRGGGRSESSPRAPASSAGACSPPGAWRTTRPRARRCEPEPRTPGCTPSVGRPAAEVARSWGPACALTVSSRFVYGLPLTSPPCSLPRSPTWSRCGGRHRPLGGSCARRPGSQPLLPLQTRCRPPRTHSRGPRWSNETPPQSRSRTWTRRARSPAWRRLPPAAWTAPTRSCCRTCDAACCRRHCPHPRCPAGTSPRWCSCACRHVAACPRRPLTPRPATDSTVPQAHSNVFSTCSPVPQAHSNVFSTCSPRQDRGTALSVFYL